MPETIQGQVVLGFDPVILRGQDGVAIDTVARNAASAASDAATSAGGVAASAASTATAASSAASAAAANASSALTTATAAASSAAATAANLTTSLAAEVVRTGITYATIDLRKRVTSPVDLLDSPYAEKYGAIADGQSHTLASLGFASLANAQAGIGGVMPDGTTAPAYPKAVTLADEADWCALMAALAGTRGCKLRSGATYVVNRSVSVGTNRSLHCDHPKKTAAVSASAAFDQVNYTGNSVYSPTNPRVVELLGAQAQLRGIYVRADKVSFQFQGDYVAGFNYAARDVVRDPVSNTYVQAVAGFTSGTTVAGDGAAWTAYTGAPTIPASPSNMSVVDCVQVEKDAFNATVRDTNTYRGRDAFHIDDNEVHFENVLAQNAARRGYYVTKNDFVAFNISTNNCGIGYYDTAGSSTIFHGHMINSVGNGWQFTNGCLNVFLFGCEADTSGGHGYYVDGRRHKFVGCWGFKSGNSSSQTFYNAPPAATKTYADWYLTNGIEESSWIGCNSEGSSYSAATWQFAGGNAPKDRGNSIVGCTATTANGTLVVGNPQGYEIIACSGGLSRYADVYSVQHSPLTTGESTFDRLDINSASGSVAVGTMRLAYFTAVNTETISQVRWKQGTVVPTTAPTLEKLMVFSVANDGTHTPIAVAGNPGMFDTASNPNTKSFLSLTTGLAAPWLKVQGQRYAIGVLAAGGAGSISFQGFAATDSAEMGVAPRISGNMAGLTDVPSAPFADSAVASTASFIPYFVLTP